MKQYPILFLLLFCFEFSVGQIFNYPNIINSGKKVKDFVPEGWDLIDSASNDLNNDLIRDYAFVIEYSDSITSIKTNNDGSDTVKYQPRILIIAFTNPVSKQLQLVEQNNRFVLVHDDPTMEDPFQSIKIEKGILTIDFQLFYNMGSSYITNTTYQFNYQNNTFQLIAADNNSIHRATHEIEEYSYDFTNRKWCILTGNDNEEEKQQKECHDLQLPELKTLQTLLEPYTWEVSPGVFL